MGCEQIIALDLGKFKTVACLMDTATRRHRFESFAMSPADLHQLLATHATPSPHCTLVVFETCDTAGWVHDVCSALARKLLGICWSMLKHEAPFRTPGRPAAALTT